MDQKQAREKEEPVKYQPVNETKGRVTGPKAHKKASAGARALPLCSLAFNYGLREHFVVVT